MIKENSLRLGNKVMIGGKVATVSSVYWEGNNSNITLIRLNNSLVEEYRVSEIEPIILTDEWFEDFGFEKTAANQHRINLPYKMEGEKVMVTGITINNPLIHSYTVNAFWGEKRFKYVHELQNLFFMIANEDLVTKKDKL